MSMALVILAAGQGTRMNSDLPKVLHPIGGAPMLVHAIRSGEVLEPARIVVVTGHGGEAVARAADACGKAFAGTRVLSPSVNFTSLVAA